MHVLAILALLAISLLAQEGPAQIPVHLNHAYITPDATTYEAIRNSPEVKKLFVWEERTTHRKDITYTGFYLYGAHTYFEFLKPDDREKAQGSQIAFGVDESGGLAPLRTRAEAAGMKIEQKEITRQFNGKDVPWFTSIQEAESKNPSLGIWTLEYQPTFLAQWNPRRGAKAGVSREAVLARYAAVVKQNPTAKPVADVIGIYYDVTQEGLERSIKECKLLGWRALGGDTTGFCTDGQVTINLRVRQKTSGVAAVRFKLRKDAKEAQYHLGSTILIVREHTALWNFRGDKESFPVGPEDKERD